MAHFTGSAQTFPKFRNNLVVDKHLGFVSLREQFWVSPFEVAAAMGCSLTLTSPGGARPRG
jgi:hypothetical protein